jgi:hypothetical protein
LLVLPFLAEADRTFNAEWIAFFAEGIAFFVLDLSLAADEEGVTLLLGVFMVASASAAGAALLLGIFLPVLTGANRSSSDSSSTSSVLADFLLDFLSDSDDEAEALLFLFGLLPVCRHGAGERGAGELVPLLGMAGSWKGLSFEAVP